MSSNLPLQSAFDPRFPAPIDDGTSITRKNYAPGQNGADVVLYIIESGGHTWPGQPPPVNFLGKSTRNLSANDLIWNFFRTHPMK